MPRTPIARIVKMIGRELGTGLGPSEEVLAVGPDWRTLGPPRKPSEACSLRSAANARTFRSAAVALTRIVASGVRTEFAPDSPLEEVGFEPSGPQNAWRLRGVGTRSRRLSVGGETSGAEITPSRNLGRVTRY